MTFPHPKTLPLWQKWNTKQLQKKYFEGPREFRRGFQLDAMSDDERKLPHFDQAVKAGRGLTVEKLLTIEAQTTLFMGVDPGGSSRPGTALFILGLNSGSRIPLYIKYGQFGPRQFAEAVVNTYLHWSPYVNWLPVVVYIENNSLQESYLELVRLLPGAPVIPLVGCETGRNKSDPTIGIEGLDTEFIQGNWTIPAGEFYDHDIGCTCDWCRWYSEVLNYPNYPTSDGLMAMWFAWRALRKGDANQGKAMSSGDIKMGLPEKQKNIELGVDNALESWDI